MKKKAKSETGGGANWMDTYGDMVTLLLCFFVLLYSFSNIDASKWAELVVAFGGSPGVLTSNESVIDQVKQTIVDDENVSVANSDSSAQKLYEELKQYVIENGMSEDVLVVKSGDEILVRFANNVLFDTGDAIIRPEAEGIMSQIAEAMVVYAPRIKMIRIEGHTDNVPIHTRQFPSNWELSTTRAVNVLRYVIETQGYPLDKISAVGYGEYHPAGDNSTEDGRRMNRRVDFLIDVMPEK
jgi:chemotaxis protein MotB